MSPETPFLHIDGRCRCERVRFRMKTAPMITHCCHCRPCQQLSGSAFGAVAMIETDRLIVLQGETGSFQGARGQTHVHCAQCRSLLWSHRGDLGEVVAFVAVGTLDAPDRLPPEAHYFIRSKHPWVTLPPGVPAFEELGDPGKAGVRERIMAALSSRQQPRAMKDGMG